MRRISEVFLLFAFLIFMAALFFMKPPAQPAAEQSVKPHTAKYSVQRFNGSDRYSTDIMVTDYGWGNRSENIVIVSGEDYPDALSAAPFAAKLKAPLLLVKKTLLDESVKNEIIKLRPVNAYIIGGQGSVSSNIADTLNKMGINIIRIEGRNRCETSLKIAGYMGSSGKVFIAADDDYADAVSLTSIAAKENMPIIFCSKNTIPEELKEYLKNNNVTECWLIGGPSALSNNISEQLSGCIRIYGNNRYETNVEIINTFYDKFDFKNVFIVNGNNLADAVSCASLAGINSSPIILVGGNEDKSTEDLLKYVHNSARKVCVLGGEYSVPSWSIDTEYHSANAADSLYIPTYERSSQSCHPKVLYFKDGWNGWKYWMSMTPYPNGNDSYENASIVVSDTGTKWNVPRGLSNPLSPKPKKRKEHGSDPELVYNPQSNNLELWYRFTIIQKRDNIYRMVSHNGIDWSKPQLMVSFYGQQTCMSPAIIFEKNKYRMWYINEYHRCMYIESNDGGRSWSKPVRIELNLAKYCEPWHIDMVHTDLGYEAVFCGGTRKDLDKNNRVLYYNISKDGIHFEHPEIILKASDQYNAWDNKQIYRSSFVKVDGVYRLYYSAMDKNTKWHIGLTEGYSLNKLHGYY